jgi:hypothetical protein
MIVACRPFSVSHVVIGIIVSFALLFCPADAAAQASRVGATLEGAVRDTSGARSRSIIRLKKCPTIRQKTECHCEIQLAEK